MLGIRLIHSAPGRPQGRGKIERFFRTLRDGLLVELESAGAPPSLEELGRLLQAWIERIYHRRVALGDRGDTACALGGFTRALPDRRRSCARRSCGRRRRLVTKTATVSLLGNRYEVDQALCGRRVELRFDPYDLERIEVYYAGRPFGQAWAHQIGRHVHPHARSRGDQPRPASGIDYLRLIGQDHERDWLARRINYHELPPPPTPAGARARCRSPRRRR